MIFFPLIFSRNAPFLDIEGDRSKLKCLLCDMVLEVDEENQDELIFNHFQSHPEQLQKICWEKEKANR